MGPNVVYVNHVWESHYESQNNALVFIQPHENCFKVTQPLHLMVSVSFWYVMGLLIANANFKGSSKCVLNNQMGCCYLTKQDQIRFIYCFNVISSHKYAIFFFNWIGEKRLQGRIFTTLDPTKTIFEAAYLANAYAW